MSLLLLVSFTDCKQDLDKHLNTAVLVEIVDFIKRINDADKNYKYHKNDIEKETFS